MKESTVNARAIRKGLRAFLAVLDNPFDFTTGKPLSISFELFRAVMLGLGVCSISWDGLTEEEVGEIVRKVVKEQFEYARCEVEPYFCDGNCFHVYIEGNQ